MGSYRRVEKNHRETRLVLNIHVLSLVEYATHSLNQKATSLNSDLPTQPSF